MRRAINATVCAVVVGWACIWASDYEIAQACATQGRARLLSGKVIECRVVTEARAIVANFRGLAGQ